MELSSISPFITDPKVITQFFPILDPGEIKDPAPIQVPWPIDIGLVIKSKVVFLKQKFVRT